MASTRLAALGSLLIILLVSALAPTARPRPSRSPFPLLFRLPNPLLPLHQLQLLPPNYRPPCQGRHWPPGQRQPPRRHPALRRW
jgi:hypothetical protein